MGILNFPKKFPILLSLLIIFLLLAGIGEAAKLRVRVIVERANIRLRPDIKSPVIAKAPIGTVLESEGKEGRWYKVNLPPDESGFVVSGYIHENIVEVVEEIKEVLKEEKVEEEKQPEVITPVIKEPAVREERPARVEPRYVPKRVPKRNFAISFYPSYGIVSMSDVNKIFDELNRWMKLDYPEEKDELENLGGGLDFFFEGRFFLLPKIAVGLGVGRIARNSDFISVTEPGEMDFKFSGFSFTLNGYIYPFSEYKISPYIGGGIGMLFYSEKIRVVEYGDEDKGKYSGTGLVFHFAGGAEYFLLSSLSIGGEIGYRIAKVRTIKVKESDFYGQRKGEILIWDSSEASGGWEAVSEDDLEYYERLGYKKRSGDFSGLSVKINISFYF